MKKKSVHWAKSNCFKCFIVFLLLFPYSFAIGSEISRCVLGIDQYSPPEENYVAITVTPTTAIVKIDGIIVANEGGQISKVLSVGTHTYEVGNPKYHSQSGTFEIQEGKTTFLKINLKPNFGSMDITSTPEEGASVYIDGVLKGLTPLIVEEVPSGTYQLEVVMEMYVSNKQSIKVSDGETAFIEVKMQPDFAEPVIVCEDPSASIYVDGEYKGNGSWIGRLQEGAYRVEARKEHCTSTFQIIKVKIGENPNIVLEAPIPLKGKLNVNSKPFGADIFIDGTKVGTTPQIIDNLSIGEHDLQLRSQDHGNVLRVATIVEGRTTNILVDFLNSKEVIINTSPAGAELAIDGMFVGKAPLETSLSYGTHTIRADLDGERAIKELEITNNTKPGITLVLQDSSKFSSPFYRMSWETFFTINGAFSSHYDWSCGFKIGQVKVFGWYLSLMSNFQFKGFGRTFSDREYHLTGVTHGARHSLLVGFVVRPADAISLHLGAGFGYNSQCFQNANDVWYTLPSRTILGVDVAFGLTFHIQKFLISMEAVTTNFKTIEGKLGIGFSLPNNNE